MITHTLQYLALRAGRALSSLALLIAVTAAASAQTAPPGRAQPLTQPPPVAEPAVVAPGPVGVWIDHTGRGAVEITQCGQSLCGNIVWLKDPNDKEGRPLRDGYNSDRSKRTRTICGLPIIGGVKLQRDGSWDEGWIYDPERGEAFDVELRMRNPDLLQVKGYKGLKFLNETYQWRRASGAPFQRCKV